MAFVSIHSYLGMHPNPLLLCFDPRSVHPPRSVDAQLASQTLQRAVVRVRQLHVLGAVIDFGTTTTGTVSLCDHGKHQKGGERRGNTQEQGEAPMISAMKFSEENMFLEQQMGSQGTS